MGIFSAIAITAAYVFLYIGRTGQINGLVHNQNGTHIPPPPPGFVQQQQQQTHMNSFGKLEFKTVLLRLKL